MRMQAQKLTVAPRAELDVDSEVRRRRRVASHQRNQSKAACLVHQWRHEQSRLQLNRRHLLRLCVEHLPLQLQLCTSWQLQQQLLLHTRNDLLQTRRWMEAMRLHRAEGVMDQPDPLGSAAC